MMTWGRYYWPAFLIAFLACFLPAEIYALFAEKGSGNDNTLSNWVWVHLRIIKGEFITQWSATDFLIFGGWITLILWLTFHFFFRKFT